jgi:hypothetical protein
MCALRAHLAIHIEVFQTASARYPCTFSSPSKRIQRIQERTQQRIEILSLETVRHLAPDTFDWLFEPSTVLATPSLPSANPSRQFAQRWSRLIRIICHESP